jgi:hypothetical protein
MFTSNVIDNDGPAAAFDLVVAEEFNGADDEAVLHGRQPGRQRFRIIVLFYRNHYL